MLCVYAECNKVRLNGRGYLNIKQHYTFTEIFIFSINNFSYVKGLQYPLSVFPSRRQDFLFRIYTFVLKKHFES